MTRIELAPEVLDDFDRFFEHIAQFDPASAPQRIGDILEAIQILTHSPQIGRPVKAGKRELIIGRAKRGYVALYRYVAAIDTVFVLAVRAQREDGFTTTPKHVSEPAPSYGQVPADANADLKGSLAAIKRAAVRARQLAEQTATDLIVMRAGKVVRVPPKQKLST